MLKLCLKYSDMVTCISTCSLTSRPFSLQCSQSTICYLDRNSENKLKFFFTHFFLQFEYFITNLSLAFSEKNRVLCFLSVLGDIVTDPLEIVIPLMPHLIFVSILLQTKLFAVLYDHVVEVGIILGSISRNSFQEKFVDYIKRVGVIFLFTCVF